MTRVRLTGLGAGPISAQWEYKESNKDVVRRVLMYLEDRRVLFSFHTLEQYDHCRQSAQKIRDFMNIEIPNVKMGGEIEASFRKIRSASRDFVSAAGADSKHFLADHQHFLACLHALRVNIGTEVAWLAAEFDIPLEVEFARSLPVQELDWMPGFEDEEGNVL